MKNTCITDIDELIDKFLDAEDQNFTLFNYVSELNEEIEKLEEHIVAIGEEINQYTTKGQELDKENEKVVQTREQNLKKSEDQNEMYDKKHEEALGVVSNMKNEIQSMYQSLGCDTPAVKQIIGNNGVTEQNIMEYLGIIEQRAYEILQVYSSDQQQKSEDVDILQTTLGSTGGSLPGNVAIIVQPPTTAEGDDVDDSDTDLEDDKPMSMEMLQMKATKMIQRRGDFAIKIVSGTPNSPTKKK